MEKVLYWSPTDGSFFFAHIQVFSIKYLQLQYQEEQDFFYVWQHCTMCSVDIFVETGWGKINLGKCYTTFLIYIVICIILFKFCI